MCVSADESETTKWKCSLKQKKKYFRFIIGFIKKIIGLVSLVKPINIYMKYLVTAPLEAALRAGGCTLEPEIGWWTYSTEELSELGKNFQGGRDALYIPTLQKTGEPVATEHVQKLREHANSLGFSNETPASGMWVLSETGEVQIEYIWIIWTTRASQNVRARISNLAKKIKELTNQDAVAYELDGELNFI